MRMMRLSVTVLSVAAVLACSDRTPTSPALASKGTSMDPGTASPPLEPRAAVHGTTPRGRHGGVPEGVWGGADASLTTRRDGGLIQLFCSFGTIDQAIVTDRNGHFDVAGTHTPMTGALPIGGLPGYAARYSGTTDGRTMTLTVSVPDLQRVLGPFSLTFGVSSTLTPCMLP